MLATPESMKRMHLLLMREDGQLAALALAELGVLHPEVATADIEELDEYPAQAFEQIFHRIQTRYRKIVELRGKWMDEIHLDATAAPAGVDQTTLTGRPLDTDDLLEVDGQVRELWARISSYEEQLRQIKDRRSGVSQLQGSLQRFLTLDVDLSRVGRQSRFLNVMAGTIDRANTSQLARALSLPGYLLERFHTSEELDYVLIAGPTGQSEEVIELLRSADFRELPIPGEFSDRPSRVLMDLNRQAAELDRETAAKLKELAGIFASNLMLLQRTERLLQLVQPYAQLSGFLKGKQRIASLQGWVPESSQQQVHDRLKQYLQYPFQLSFTAPQADEYTEVPTLLRSNPIVAPFQCLVRQYGLPRYCEFDPGALFAISYTLMFGMMFGDVGHGAVIVLLALLFWRRSRVIAVIGGLAGMSSMLFGFLYGSLFGYEEILHPWWMSPMHDPQHVLLLALYWGIGFLVVAHALAIRNLFIFGPVRKALYAPQGITGLLFYLIAVYGLIQAFDAGSELSAWVVALLTLLMAGMLYYLWRESQGQMAERLLVVLIEGLEFIINNVSATLSFLRVAAFSLNHIALAAAVFAIANMLDPFGHWLTVLLGNVFIIVLEGAIVAIQCLRLEYYEGFSRFFSGEGRRFQPLKTDYL